MPAAHSRRQTSPKPARASNTFPIRVPLRLPALPSQPQALRSPLDPKPLSPPAPRPAVPFPSFSPPPQAVFPAKHPPAATQTSPSKSGDRAAQTAFSIRHLRLLVALPAHPGDQMLLPTELPEYDTVLCHL